MRNAQRAFERIGEGGWREIIAVGFDHEANDGAVMNIKRACANQIFIHNRIEETVIGDIV
ncbi:hypothetical protein MNBD_ALPHA05-668, partial [hydrothermal vent metagenome]